MILFSKLNKLSLACFHQLNLTSYNTSKYFRRAITDLSAWPMIMFRKQNKKYYLGCIDQINLINYNKNEKKIGVQ